MKIEDAHKIKPGDRVLCPEDRGNPQFVGTVKFCGKTIGIAHNGDAYLWFTLADGKGVWPSNRVVKVG